MSETITVDARFRGPVTSGNGGYVCGRLAAFVPGAVEVTLRRPPPLGQPLRIERTDEGSVRLRDGDVLVAEARPARLNLIVPDPPTLAEAEEATTEHAGFEHQVFASCFVCGAAREPGDGLRIFAGAVRGRDIAAAPWTPHTSTAEDGRVRHEFLWAALDCPGVFAPGVIQRTDRLLLLGRLAAQVDAVPAPGEPCIVVGWKIATEGRKTDVGTAIFSSAGALYAKARGTWVEMIPTAGDRP
jgi:hypothetical protein